MYQLINQSTFVDAFRYMGRENQFSFEGKIALFKYLEEMEECTFEKVGIELDVISLCCDFTEYENMDDLNKQEGSEYKNCRELEYDTQVIMYTDNESPILIANF